MICCDATTCDRPDFDHLRYAKRPGYEHDMTSQSHDKMDQASPPFLHNASDQELEGGKARERG